MDVIFEVRKKRYTIVKWNVGLPRVGYPVKSNSFVVHGYSWYFYFESSAKIGEECWTMTLYTSEGKHPPMFPLRVYIQDNGRGLYQSQKEVSSYSTKIWESSSKKFKIEYPNIQIIGTVLQFEFDFNLVHLGRKIRLKENKYVQTSANYSEERACLENLSLDLCKLVEDGCDPDVQLKCGDFSMGAHKLILGARSEVFHNMMKSDMMEGREGFVEIIDMEPKILEIFIKYIYTGILPELTVDTALTLYEAADKYQVEALKKRSGHFLAENVSPERALGILVTADAHSDIDLKCRLVSYIVEEDVPSTKEEWLKFCDQYPKLAVDVLNLCHES